jgi:hypothetical protein
MKFTDPCDPFVAIPLLPFCDSSVKWLHRGSQFHQLSSPSPEAAENGVARHFVLPFHSINGRTILMTDSGSSLPDGFIEISFSSLGQSCAEQWSFKDKKTICQEF